MNDAMERYLHWRSQAELDPELALELTEIQKNEAEIKDRFYRELAFGTGGLRGILGAGTNRMNVCTVRKATQGLANYLNGTNLPKSVAIAYDSRIKSDLFARETAQVLAANGITAYLYSRLEPTPALSWAVRYLSCGAGVCVTASHNPAQYNGYKVYGADGCQITLEAASKIQGCIELVDCFQDVKTADFSAALEKGTIQFIPEDCLDAFLEAVLAQRVGDGTGVSGLKLVYTPLCGSGLECVTRLLDKLGGSQVTVVPEQEQPDGTFPTCPYPNPEIREAMGKGLELCEKVKPDLLLGTDPDCDRCGVAVPDGQAGSVAEVPLDGSSYKLLTGNELGVLLLDYICRARQAAGTMPQDPVTVTTIVSTPMADPVAAKYGVELRRTLTGCTFLGAQRALQEKAGHPERYLYGFEESYGYLSGPHVRDKDAVNAALLVCEAAGWYAGQGKTLLDGLNDLYAEFGYYRSALRSFAFPGADGMARMNRLMQRLRENPPTAFAGFAVERVVDYSAGGTGLPPADVLEFRLAGGARVMVRPSGTEPKLKLYLSAVAETEEQADELLDQLAAAAADWMQ
ncbi:MAG: phospho-sugar mutase [Clostridiales bacterium]|nr:phospho-sugar mutase [Clostridiales bacterium]